MRQWVVALLVSHVFLSHVPTLSLADPPIELKPGGEFKQGRYLGFLSLPDSKERLAVTADVFLESPEDFTQFPHLTAIVKVNLGQPGSSEYVTDIFENIQYDFDGGMLTFDEPASNLAINGGIYKSEGKTLLLGDVWIKSAVTSGRLRLEFQSDEPEEPGDDDRSKEPSPSNVSKGEEINWPLIPSLEGQYEGQCGAHDAVIQIQTQRGLLEENEETGGALRGYRIAGRIGYKEPGNCNLPGEDIFCTYHQFWGGNYDFFSGTLTLSGQSTAGTECILRQGKLDCRLRTQGESISCIFSKDPGTTLSRFFERKFHVQPTADQRKELPPPAPPHNMELARALQGQFSGYLHHELSDRYQPIRLQVNPSSSTNNPHNPNQIFVSTSVVRYFGNLHAGSSLSEQYAPRSFYLRSGFVLSGENADSFIAIDEWKMGSIRGVWYSHEFGRVGTVELIKGALPTLPSQARTVKPVVGEYETKVLDSGRKFSRWIKFMLPSQPIKAGQAQVRFSGAYQSIVGATQVGAIEKGSYDPYTGNLSWVLNANEASTLASGHIDEASDLQLFWPPFPNVIQTVMRNYKFVPFKRVR